MITQCPSVYIGEHVKHANGIIVIRTVKLFTGITE